MTAVLWWCSKQLNSESRARDEGKKQVTMSHAPENRTREPALTGEIESERLSKSESVLLLGAFFTLAMSLVTFTTL